MKPSSFLASEPHGSQKKTLDNFEILNMAQFPTYIFFITENMFLILAGSVHILKLQQI